VQPTHRFGLVSPIKILSHFAIEQIARVSNLLGDTDQKNKTKRQSPKVISKNWPNGPNGPSPSSLQSPIENLFPSPNKNPVKPNQKKLSYIPNSKSRGRAKDF